MPAVRLAILAMLPILAACNPGAEPADVVMANGAPAPLPGPETIAAAPAGDFQTGEDVIRALYAQPTIPNTPDAIRRFFPEEFVAGLTPPEGEVGLIDFDYRISGQDGEPDGLTVEEMAGGPSGSLLISRFSNLGVAKEVTWTVCRQPNGALRIVEARFPGAGDQTAWSLRQLLDLPKRGDAC